MQVAYLMADISNVQYAQIKDITESLEALSCKHLTSGCTKAFANNDSLYYDSGSLLTRPKERVGRSCFIFSDAVRPLIIAHDSHGNLLKKVLSPRPPSSAIHSLSEHHIQQKYPFRILSTCHSASRRTSTNTFKNTSSGCHLFSQHVQFYLDIYSQPAVQFRKPVTFHCRGIEYHLTACKMEVLRR